MMGRTYIYGDLTRTNAENVHPAALLPKAKQQMRVKFADDDAYITDLLTRAIAWVEVNADICVDKQTWEWSLSGQAIGPASCSCEVHSHGAYGYDLPKRPIISMTVSDGNGQDLLPQMTLVKQQDSTGITETKSIRSSSSVITAPMKWVMQCGYATTTDLPPMVVDAILRYTAYLYENREAWQNIQLYESPDFVRSVLGPLWVPRV